MKTLTQPLALGCLLFGLLVCSPAAAIASPSGPATCAPDDTTGAKHPGKAYTVTYGYDAQGRLTAATYDAAFTINYTYDAAGNITAIVAAPSGPTAVEEEAGLPLFQFDTRDYREGYRAFLEKRRPQFAGE